MEAPRTGLAVRHHSTFLPFTKGVALNRLLSFAAGGLLALGALGAAQASLIGQNIGVSITATGQDDNGFYTINIFNGSVSAASGLDISQAFSRQLTQGGFATPSNVLSGTATVDITASSITVGFSGQAQPFSLDFDFTGIGDPIVSMAVSDAGIISGVNSSTMPSFGTSLVSDMGFTFFGFQTGTNVTQTAALTFRTVNPPGTVPEPASLALLCTALAGLAATRKRRTQASM